jgi:putative transposase
LRRARTLAQGSDACGKSRRQRGSRALARELRRTSARRERIAPAHDVTLNVDCGCCSLRVLRCVLNRRKAAARALRVSPFNATFCGVSSRVVRSSRTLDVRGNIRYIQSRVGTVNCKLRSQRSRALRGEQLVFRFRTWGGARPGAGRPRSSTRMAHVRREPTSRHAPCHVTVRLVPGLPSLRAYRVFRVVRAALAATKLAHVVEYSVMSNHLHLLVEAESAQALARGMRSITIRIAKRLNAFLRRRGRVFVDRYHSRALRSPREVRNALVYVLNNFRRHADQSGPRLPLSYVDPCSSAGFFEGWDPEWTHAPPDRRAFRDPYPNVARGTVPARSFLLRHGWKRHGLLRPFELPAR